MKKISLLLFTSIIAFSCSNKPDFDRKGKETFKGLKDLSNLSLQMNSVTGEVWHKAIYDKKYALCKSTNFEDCYVSDFNYALQRFNQEENVINLRKSISEIENTISLNMDSLSNPSSKNKEVYENLIDLNKNVKELSSEAKNPTGSLTSFIDKSNKLSGEINLLITEIETRKSDWKN
ncbi:hypothetical protein [Empedobacter brevis]|uniref:hypothetical protein n=1 Tax=Empedobacter brevis TaxID=247 RepID=UPI00333EE9ED